jgi:hypothetical protein
VVWCPDSGLAQQQWNLTQKTDFGSKCGGREYQTEEYARISRIAPMLHSVLICAPNAEFGPISLRSASYARQEDFFEMGSNQNINDICGVVKRLSRFEITPPGFAPRLFGFLTRRVPCIYIWR